MPYSREHKSKSKQRILESATELFCRYGFAKVSITQIMKLARMTHGAFYAHFDSKEALYKASFFQTLRKSRSKRLAKAPLSIHHLTQLVNNLLNLRTLTDRTEPALENILFNEIGSDSPDIKRLYEQSYINILKLLETRLTALTRLKHMPTSTDLEEKSRTILATLVGAVAIAKSIQSEVEIKKVLTAAQNQVLRSLGVSELAKDFAALDQRSLGLN